MGASHEAKWIVAEIEKQLETKENFDLAEAKNLSDKIVERRKCHEPLAYIFGHWAFRSYEFFVGPGALIPRPESEELVEYALSFVEKSETLIEKLFDENGLNIVDAGAGTGCIGLSFVMDLLKDLANEGFDPKDISAKIRLVLIELSPEARAHLEKNIKKYRSELYESRIEVFSGSWLQWPRTQIDLLLSNPPYLTLSELRACDVSVRDFEPSMALMPDDISTFPDASGPYRELFQIADECLSPGGYAIFECGLAQPIALEPLVPALKNFDKLRFYRDMARKDRFLAMRKKESENG